MKTMSFPARSSLVLASLALMHCGRTDTRNLPADIHVKAVAGGGYHVHAAVVFQARNPIKYACTGIFGDGINEKEDVYDNIPESGIKMTLKKSAPGFCDYRFSLLDVVCTKAGTYDATERTSFHPVTLGILDSAGNASRTCEGTFYSAHRIFDGSLVIQAKGDGIHSWGCKDDCENEDDFGIGKTDTALTITCGEEGNAVQSEK